MNTPDLTDPLGSALWLAARGWHIHPLDHPELPVCAGARTSGHVPEQCPDDERGKHPCTKWSERATTDPRQITAWFAGRLRNLGVACKPSGLLVVDEDRPGGLARYAASRDQVIPETFTVTTGKGAHFYFTQPAGQRFGNGAGALAEYGCDVRGANGKGGYVVGPGSVHRTGVLYSVTTFAAPAAPPAWLLNALCPPPSVERRASPPGQLARSRRSRVGLLASLVRVVLDAPAPTATQPGGRNNALFWAAARAAEHARNGALDFEDARAALTEAARRTGLNDKAAEATIESAHRNVIGART